MGFLKRAGTDTELGVEGFKTYAMDSEDYMKDVRVKGYVGYKNPAKGNYNADLDLWPYREVERRSYSVAVSTGVGSARRVQLLTVPRRVGLVTYLG